MKTQLKVGITGASGFVGQAVVEALARAGHLCVGFSRSPERAVKGCAETRRFGETLDVKGLDAVVHLAGESIMGLPTGKKLRGILESRREGTRAVVDAISRAGAQGPKTFVSASAVGYYGDTGEQIADESSPAGSGFLAEVAKVWEAEAHRAEAGGVRVAILRFGVVLGEGGGMVKALKPVFRLGLGATLGSGRPWVAGGSGSRGWMCAMWPGWWSLWSKMGRLAGCLTPRPPCRCGTAILPGRWVAGSSAGCCFRLRHE